MNRQRNILIVFLVIGWVVAALLGVLVWYQATHKPNYSPTTQTPEASTPAQNAEPTGTVSPGSASPDVASNSTPAANAPAKSLHTPASGSAERKAILDALRPEIESYLGQKVVFQVETLNVKNDYAFFQGGPLTPAGKAIDFSKVNANYKKALNDGLASSGSSSICALLQYKNGAWRLVTKNIGATDVTYVTWWKDYSAPKEIFPYTE